MSWCEFIDSTQAVSVDWTGSMVGTRVYKVWDYSRTLILTNPSSIIGGPSGIESLPTINSSWEGMKLDRYDVSPGPGNVFVVQGMYSTDGRFTNFSGPNYDEPQWQVSFQTVPMPFVYATPVTSAVALGDGAQLLSYNYEPKEKTVGAKMVRYSRRIDLEQADYDQAVFAVGLENNSLHLIGGKVYLFEASDIIPKGGGKFYTNYSWIYDRGWLSSHLVRNPNTAISYPLDLQYFNGAAPYAGAIWTRPPFHHVIPYFDQTNAPGPVAIPPKYDAVCELERRDIGWTNLPGAF